MSSSHVIIACHHHMSHGNFRHQLEPGLDMVVCRERDGLIRSWLFHQQGSEQGARVRAEPNFENCGRAWGFLGFLGFIFCFSYRLNFGIVILGIVVTGWERSEWLGVYPRYPKGEPGPCAAAVDSADVWAPMGSGASRKKRRHSSSCHKRQEKSHGLREISSLFKKNHN